MDSSHTKRHQTDAKGRASEGEVPKKSPSMPRAKSALPTIPDYELLRRIGGGAYGEVWLARSHATGALRAAKIVWRRTFEDERPFQREFEGIQRFEKISREHPCQLALFHIGRNDSAGYFYYVIELADNLGKTTDYSPHTLRADLERGRPPIERCLRIGLALTEALDHLHSNGLIHRDVKPSNVIFVNGRPKLADIGLVTDASDRCSIVGTEGYLPPEGPGTSQADIFALGKVLYELATGLDRREFPRLPDGLRSWPDAPRVFELNEIILKACAPSHKERYNSCGELHVELALLAEGGSIKRIRARRRLLALASRVIVAVLVILAALAGFFWRNSSRNKPSAGNFEAKLFYDRALRDLRTSGSAQGHQAYENLLEALKRDPQYLDAYYLMFETEFHGNEVPEGNDWIAKNLAELAPESGEFHAVNSWIKFNRRVPNKEMLEEAVHEAKLATELSPSLMRPHGLYGWYLELVHGDSQAALEEYNKAEKIGPPDATIEMIKAEPYYMETNFDQSIVQLKKAIQLNTNLAEPHRILSDVYEADKQYDLAIDEHEVWQRLSGADQKFCKTWHENMHSILHNKGPQAWWRAQLNDQTNYSQPDPYWMAQVNARLGNSNEVFTFLNQAHKEHNYRMIYLLEDDHWWEYRNTGWFKDLVEETGLHPKSGGV